MIVKGTLFGKKNSYYLLAIDIKPSLPFCLQTSKDAKLIISLVASQFTLRCGRVKTVSIYLLTQELSRIVIYKECFWYLSYIYLQTYAHHFSVSPYENKYHWLNCFESRHTFSVPNFRHPAGKFSG